MTCQLLNTQNVFPSHEVENIRVAIIILMQCSFAEKPPPPKKENHFTAGENLHLIRKSSNLVVYVTKSYSIVLNFVWIPL